MGDLKQQIEIERMSIMRQQKEFFAKDPYGQRIYASQELAAKNVEIDDESRQFLLDCERSKPVFSWNSIALITTGVLLCTRQKRGLSLLGTNGILAGFAMTYYHMHKINSQCWAELLLMETPYAKALRDAIRREFPNSPWLTNYDKHRQAKDDALVAHIEDSKQRARQGMPRTMQLQQEAEVSEQWQEAEPASQPGLPNPSLQEDISLSENDDDFQPASAAARREMGMRGLNTASEEAVDEPSRQAGGQRGGFEERLEELPPLDPLPELYDDEAEQDGDGDDWDKERESDTRAGKARGESVKPKRSWDEIRQAAAEKMDMGKPDSLANRRENKNASSESSWKRVREEKRW